MNWTWRPDDRQIDGKRRVIR